MEPYTSQSQQSSFKVWGEERVDGAVYTIYLKKIRYNCSSMGLYVDCPSPQDDVSHLQWETLKQKSIKCGTLEKLVEALTTESGDVDTTCFSVFFATYRSFATPRDILNLIIDRYRSLAKDPDVRQALKEKHRKSLRNLFGSWLDRYPEDFCTAPDYTCLHTLRYFAEHELPGKDIMAKCNQKLTDFSRENQLDCSINVGEVTIEGSINCDILKHEIAPWSSFMEVSVSHLAEQLTYIDADLFRKVVAHHCLGYLWSRRHKGSLEAPSVQATVKQFNAVIYRVISTIVGDVKLKPTERARVITKWILLAQELRFLKNFSSLKAAISGLQSNPVYRLKRAWLAVPRETYTLFQELSRLFSEENNQMASRELLMKEGTAKCADENGTQNGKLMRKLMMNRKSSNLELSMHGTVPYLGTFLTDLTMIDTALPDIVEDNYINFEKKRREFEVLAQIKLLQSAANLYHIIPDPKFRKWWDSLPVLTDDESYDLSCEIEPLPNQTLAAVAKDARSRKKLTFGFMSFGGHQRQFSDSGISMQSYSPSDSICDGDKLSLDSAKESSDSAQSSPSGQKSFSLSCTSSLTSLDADKVTSPYKFADSFVIRVSYEAENVSLDADGPIYKSIMISRSDTAENVIRTAMLKHNILGRPEDYCLAQVLGDEEISIAQDAKAYYVINQMESELNFVLRKKSHPKAQCSPYRFSDFCIIKVSMDDGENEEDLPDGPVYKSIQLTNRDHTPSVIKVALAKHGIAEPTGNFCLSQVVPGGELQIPVNANVFYAMTNTYDLKFVLRRRAVQDDIENKRRPRTKWLIRPPSIIKDGSQIT